MVRSRGFTLIELMIVVVVMGILAAIAIPNFLSMQERAKDAGVKSNMHSVQFACSDFNVLANGRYMRSLDDVTPEGYTIVKLMEGGVAPVNPFNGRPSRLLEEPVDRDTLNAGDIVLTLNDDVGYEIRAVGADSTFLDLVLHP